MKDALKFARTAMIVMAGGLAAGAAGGWLLTLAPAPEPALADHGRLPASLAAPSQARRPAVYAAVGQTTTGTLDTTGTALLPEPAPLPALEPEPVADSVADLSLETTEPVLLEEASGPVPSLSEPFPFNEGIVIRNLGPSAPAPRAGVAAVPSSLESERVILADQIPSAPPLPPEGWDPEEFELLAAPAGEADLLENIEDGTVVEPVQPLTVEELLAADQSRKPVGYTTPGVGVGTPVPLTGTGRVPAAGYLPEGQIQLESAQFLDYDEESHTIYGHGRVIARFGQYKLEADKLLVDTRLRELQAEGNVVLTSPNEYVEAGSLQFDTKTNMGVAYQARGRSSVIYFLADPGTDGGRTTIRQLSRDETHFKNSSFTTCDFPVPHYRLSAKEFTVLASERIYARNVVLYIMEKPVLWLPYYTRSLKDENPWAIKFGRDSRLGFYTRLSYSWRQTSYTPSDVDDRLMVKRTSTQGRLMWDYFSRLGFGKGLQYRYKFNDGRHIGRVFLYQINDRGRNVEGDSAERTYADIFHRSSLGKAADGADLSALIDVDYVSDPEIFFDLFDRLRGPTDARRGRIPERHAVFGLSRTHDHYFAGVRIELRDRLGRDRFSYFSEPRDDDYDYDRRYNDEQFFTLTQPGRGPNRFNYPNAGTYTDTTQLPDILENGIASDRFGRVSERLPHLTISTNRERLWCLPLWYHLDLNVFNNLDKGLNIVGTEDDSFVHGFDLYQSLTHLKRFSDRYTLRTKVGIGFGVADRQDDSFHPDIPDNATFPFVQDGQVIGGRVIGVTYVDRDTFLVGRRRVSLRDVDPFFAYGDLDSKFSARITDSMTAFARYRVRVNAGDNLGQFYERIGSRSTRDDLYDFRTPEHWIEAGLNYRLARPRLHMSLAAGRNLQGNSDFTANELTQYVNLSTGWSNLRNTLLVNGGVSLQERQVRDPSDPASYLANSITYYLAASYLPVHQRHYARVGAFFVQNTSDDPLGLRSDNRNFDTENQTIFNATLGKKIGQKYLVEYRSQIRTTGTGTDNSWLSITRDFHDAVAGVSVGFRQDRLSNREERTEQDNLQVRFQFRLKPAAEKGVAPTRTSGDLFSARKRSAFESLR